MRFSVALKKRLNHLVALHSKDRASAIQHSPARGQQGPQTLQQLPLCRSKLRAVARTAQPSHIRMSAHDPRGGTGRIEQDGIKTLTVPPVLWSARVGGQDLGRQGQTPEVLVDALAPCLIDVNGQYPGIRSNFKQMSGLPPWSRTGIQNAQRPIRGHARQKEWSGHLGGGILNGHIPARKAGQVLNRHWLIELQATRPDSLPCTQTGCQ